MSEASRPRVSLVLPCLNEEPYIEATLRSLLGGTFAPGDMEILVVDGNSTDRTREIVDAIAREDPRVRVLDNPRRITPVALNIGIRAARGDIIVRVDSHSVFPPNYVEVLVRTLESTGADMVGGCVENIPGDDGLVCRAIALVIGSAFGTGSRIRYERSAGPADALPLGCWRREIFDRVGYFDERLLRNQDNEHSARILRAGGKLWMTDEITIRYYPRRSLRALWKQAVQNGTWNAYTEWLFPYAFRWRHFLPGLFFLGTVAATGMIAVGALVFWPLAGLGVAMVLPYTLANLFVSTRLAVAERTPALMPVLLFTYFSYHFAYGYGITRGWLQVATGRWRKSLGATPTEARVL